MSNSYLIFITLVFSWITALFVVVPLSLLGMIIVQCSAVAFVLRKALGACSNAIRYGNFQVGADDEIMNGHTIEKALLQQNFFYLF